MSFRPNGEAAGCYPQWNDAYIQWKSIIAERSSLVLSLGYPARRGVRIRVYL